MLNIVVKRIHVWNLERVLQREQFGAMEISQLRKEYFSFFQKPHLHLASVTRAYIAPHEAQLFASRDERYNTMLLSLQSFGQFAGCGPFPTRESLNIEQ